MSANIRFLPKGQVMVVEYAETHQRGHLSIENLDIIRGLNTLDADIDLTDCDFGLQVAPDGRVWVCVNGIAFLRFKPVSTNQEGK